MNLTQQDLKELEDLAYKLIGINIMAVILEVDELELRSALSDPNTPAYKAFYRGYGRQLIEQRDAIIRSAKNGSNPAQEMVAKMIVRFANDLPSV